MRAMTIIMKGSASLLTTHLNVFNAKKFISRRNNRNVKTDATKVKMRFVELEIKNSILDVSNAMTFVFSRLLSLNWS